MHIKGKNEKAVDEEVFGLRCVLDQGMFEHYLPARSL